MRQQTPLHEVQQRDSFACNNSNPDVVKALISAGAKVNAKDRKMAGLLCMLQQPTTQTQM